MVLVTLNHVTMNYRSLAYKKTGSTAWITLDRPDRENGVNLEMALELSHCCQVVNQDDSILVAVITGNGKTFSSGGDEPRPDMLQNYQASSSLSSVHKPIIAALNGDALDQGLELAIACDLRIAASGARLGLTHTARGLMPWDGGTQRLPRLVGRAHAMSLILTGQVLNAHEALQIGLVNRVVANEDIESEAKEMADKIAASGPIATRYAKEAVYKGMEMTMAQGMRLEADLNLLLHTTQDRQEGIKSFLERRMPGFRGS
jgi:enoyl-CoA hydratase